MKNDLQSRIEKFKERSIEKYGDVIDFSEMKYVNAKTEVTLIHNEYGRFNTTPDLHLRKPHWNVKDIKPFGYFNDKQNCIETAKHYKSKWDLCQHCNGCYNGLLRNGWLDEVAAMLYDKSVHYIQYEDKINIVYVYEFCEQKYFYVGRTNNLKRRDRQHKNGEKHSDGTIIYDSVYNFSVKNKIEIPHPKILEENLTAVESQEKEHYWKEKYISDGWKTLNKGITGKGKGSLGACLKWDYDACLEESKKYSYKYEMKLGNQPAYASSVKNGWINEFFSNRNKDNNYWDDFSNVLEASMQCVGARDMQKKFGGAYNSARKHEWLKLLKYKRK